MKRCQPYAGKAFLTATLIDPAGFDYTRRDLLRDCLKLSRQTYSADRVIGIDTRARHIRHSATDFPSVEVARNEAISWSAGGFTWHSIARGRGRRLRLGHGRRRYCREDRWRTSPGAFKTGPKADPPFVISTARDPRVYLTTSVLYGPKQATYPNWARTCMRRFCPSDATLLDRPTSAVFDSRLSVASCSSGSKT